MRLRPALAALSLTALLGLAACGGSSDDESATGTGASVAQPSSAAESTASEDASATAFCTDGQNSLAQFDDDLESGGPEVLATVLPQVVATLDSLDPPAEIADEFQTLRDSYDQLAEAATTNDLTTPEGQSAFEAVLTDVGATAQPAEDAVEAWTDANCGDDGASPTS